MTQMSQDDGPEINPSVIFLFDLLKWVRQGRIRVPAFQRPYVWKRANMLDLFDSVRRRYPIGTLLFWKSSTRTAGPLDRFGPFDLSQLQPSETPLLLLDGQQRLTTLAGVLLRGAGLPELDVEDEDRERWNVYFDASGGRPEVKRKEEKSNEGMFMYLATGIQAKPWQVPLYQLSDTNKLFQAVAGIFNAKPEDLVEAGVGKEVLADRLQGVARALQSYKIPIVEFVTDDLNLAVESFTRLNRKGVAIGADEMFSALTYQAGAQGGFHIASEIDGTLADIRQTGFGEVDRVLVLRAFLVAADLDPYRTDWSKLGAETRENAASKLPEAMHRARDGLLGGIDLLREEHIHNARMLPYGLQLVGLSAWLGEDPSPSDEAKRLLRRWLWLTGFSSWFGQGNPSRYAAVLAELRDRARKVRQQGAPAPSELRHLPWDTRAEPFPERYDLRSARVRTLLCLLARKTVFNPDGTSKDARAIADDFARNGPEAMRTIWARSQSRLRFSPANRMFNVFGLEHGQARTLLRRIKLIRPQEFLESHLLPYPLEVALDNSESMEQVLNQRLEDMIRLEREFMSELEIQPPASAQPGASLIDQDDEAPLMPDSEEA